MEPNQNNTYNVISNAFNNLSVNVDASLSSASDCYIGTVNADSITSPGIYDYYPSTPNIFSLPGTGIIYNSAPYSFDFSPIVYGDCFRLKSNRRHLKLEFYL